MAAIDTNVIVRYLTQDDTRQSARATELINSGPVWVSTTVLLETEWVLRAAYGLKRDEVTDALRRFAGLPTVSLQSPEIAARALDWAETGVDFADALHLACAGGQESFVTFDHRLAKAAGRIDALPVRVA